MKSTKYFRSILTFLLILTLTISLSACLGSSEPPASVPDESPLVESEADSEASNGLQGDEGSGSETSEPAREGSQGEVQIHFIDVGQGDATLIQLPAGANILIDAGDNGKGPDVVRYLKDAGVGVLDVVIFTHPHADHIGGAPDVFANFEVKKVYMPKVSHTSQTFERLLVAIQDAGLKINTGKAGISLDLDPEVSLELVAPHGENYNNLNDYSVALHMVHGANGFLITGDAEEQSEREMTRSGHNLSANLLRTGHHGSNSSTKDFFLDVVKPSIAVISCGADNRYGHPHKEVLDRLFNRGIDVYRTDVHGHIVAISTGTDYVIQTQKGEAKPFTQHTGPVSTPEPKPQSPAVETVGSQYIGNKNSSIFHVDTCSSLPAEHNRIYFDTRQEAIDAGQRPCQRCKP